MPTGPVAMPAEPGFDANDDPVAAAMLEQDLELVDTFGLVTSPGSARRAGAAPALLTIEVDPDEDAVILLEHEGVYSWRYPTQAATLGAPARRGAVQPPAKRQLTFQISTETALAGSSPRRAGPITDLIVGKIRTYVFKFVARLAVGAAIGFLERKKRTGLVDLAVDDPTRWRPFERLDAVNLPADRPARILLLVHGTFSSTLGCYGALGLTPWGRAFLASARARYDAIIGYDHKTLSRDPLQNAEDLLARLESVQSPRVEIDAVAHSRGGLVLRSLIEFLLPSSRRIRVRRAVFVGATNGGTLLAARDNWDALIDVTTNLVSVGCKVLSVIAPGAVAATIVRESISTLGALVKVLATEATSEDAVPGLAAMVPTGKFVTEINKTQLGQPTAAESLYYVVSSEFDVESLLTGQGAREFPPRLAGWLASGFMSALMGKPNDLVVNTDSMAAIDAETGGFVKDRWHFERNAHVYHTVYFTRPEVALAVARWLGLEATVSDQSRGIPAAADRHFVTVQAHEPLEAALGAIRTNGASFIIAERDVGAPSPYRYAFRSDELLTLGADAGRVPGDLSLEEALRGTPLQMHEDTSTPQAERDGIALTANHRGVTGGRIIVVDGGAPLGVIERGEGMTSTIDLLEPLRTSPERPTRGKPPPPAGTFLPARPNDGRSAAPRASTVFVSGDMPQEIQLGQSAAVNVVVSHDEIRVTAGATVATKAIDVVLDRRLVVQVIAKKNLMVVGDDFAEIDPEERRTDLLFRVEAAAVGPGEIWVQVAQGAVVLARLVLRPTIVAASATPATGRSYDAADGQAFPRETPFPVLQIFETEVGAARAYHFVMQLSDGQYLSKRSATLQRPRAEYVDGIYKQIETRWLSNSDDFEAFEQELRSYGATLFDELIPEAIQAALWQHRSTLDTIQVVAEEPFIPWEIVHLKEPGGVVSDERNFLADKGLVRWLHNQPAAPRGITIRSERSFYVIPDYPHPDWKLPEAQNEIPFLEKTFGSKAVDASSTAITRLFGRRGALDHFHFSGHGAAETANAVFAQLMLGGTIEGQSWVPRYLTSDVVAQTAQLRGDDGSRPLIVLNACQVGRLGWRLTSIGGFAESFIRRGAGAFVGSLWSVGDVPARHFSEAFYQALTRGATLSEAATEGRNAARGVGDGTYLAFVVYGAPHAQVGVSKRAAQHSAARP